uniref:Putative glycosyltransferase n=1 Tax=viral metagenome TaxID=1070528 RepID=A0A6M3ISD0_9ZZZZ
MKIGLGFNHHSFYYHTSESTAARGLGRAWLRQGHEVLFINMPKRMMPPEQLDSRFVAEHGDLLPLLVDSDSPRLDRLDVLFELFDYRGCRDTSFLRPARFCTGAFAWALSPLSAAATRNVARYRSPLFITGSQSYNEAVALGVDAYLYTVGVDTEVFHPNGAVPPSGATKFLWVGGCAPAAGPDVVLEAYFKAFSNRDNVSLTMVSPLEVTARLTREVLQRMPFDYQPPPLVYEQGNSLPSELAQLYREHTMLVLPLRFHAGCHPITEAMACGCLVVTTPWTAPLDYAAQDEALWVDYELETVTEGAQRLAERYYCMGWFRRYFRRFQTDTVYRWARPSVDSLAEIMGRVHRGDYDKSIPGRALAKAGTHTWDKAARHIIDTIEGL